MKYLNLGCGNRFHPKMTNINLSLAEKNVIVQLSKKGIPYDETLICIYHHTY